MSEDWEKELKEIKEATKKEIMEIREKEEELREKHKEDVEKILDLIYSQLKPVEETFRKEGREESYQPKIVRHPHAIYLSLPITPESMRSPGHYTTIGLTIGFGLLLTDEGYGVKVTKDIYDHTKDRTFRTEGYISPPVDVDGIQKEIRDFLRDRRFAIKMLEEKMQRLKRRL